MRARVLFLAAAVATVAVACGQFLAAEPPSDGGGGANDASADVDPSAEVLVPTDPDASPEVVAVDDAGAPDVAAALDAGTACLPNEQTTRIAPGSADGKSGNASTFTAVGVSAYWNAIDDTGNSDGDTTYVKCVDDGGDAEWIRFSRTKVTIGADRVITRVTLFIRARMETTGDTASIGIALYEDGLNKAYGGPLEPLANAYQLYARPFATHPRAGAWTQSLVDDFQLYVSCGTSSKNAVRFTQVWAEVCHAAK